MSAGLPSDDPAKQDFRVNLQRPRKLDHLGRFDSPARFDLGELPTIFYQCDFRVWLQQREPD